MSWFLSSLVLLLLACFSISTVESFTLHRQIHRFFHPYFDLIQHRLYQHRPWQRDQRRFGKTCRIASNEFIIASVELDIDNDDRYREVNGLLLDCTSPALASSAICSSYSSTPPTDPILSPTSSSSIRTTPVHFIDCATLSTISSRSACISSLFPSPPSSPPNVGGAIGGTLRSVSSAFPVSPSALTSANVGGLAPTQLGTSTTPSIIAGPANTPPFAIPLGAEPFTPVAEATGGIESGIIGIGAIGGGLFGLGLTGVGPTGTGGLGLPTSLFGGATNSASNAVTGTGPLQSGTSAMLGAGGSGAGLLSLRAGGGGVGGNGGLVGIRNGLTGIGMIGIGGLLTARGSPVGGGVNLAGLFSIGSRLLGRTGSSEQNSGMGIGRSVGGLAGFSGRVGNSAGPFGPLGSIGGGRVDAGASGSPGPAGRGLAGAGGPSSPSSTGAGSPGRRAGRSGGRGGHAGRR